MTHPDRIPDYLEHMLVCCNRIADTLRDVDFNTFVAQYSTHEVVIRQLEIIGEAAKRISREQANFFETTSLLEPALVIGMRNKLIHDYDDVDLPTVWRTATDDVPRLREGLVSLLLQIRPDADLDSLHF